MKKVNRRNFLLGTAAAAAQAGVAASLPNGLNPSGDAKDAPGTDRPKPNIVIYHSDQFRWDFVGTNGLNSSTRTPNLDALAAEGTNFTHAVTNQPLCAPSRAVTLTGRYATETGVWRNGIGLRQDLPTLATELRKAGYTTNYIGKWHLAPDSEAEGGGIGYVRPEQRGGFLDLWEASNIPEFTSHPYEGTFYDSGGNEITYKDQYRVDFLTGRAERFLRQKQEKPFLLVISQLEPHQQNDMGRMVGPRGSAERFINALVPPDLRSFPGDWHRQLPDYYGACESIDASVGRVRQILEEEKLAATTIFVFMSDHGCHFMTRNEEYKRSAHNSSLRIPLLIYGPGFEGARQIEELAGLVHLAPTLLEAAGVAAPKSMQGRSLMPLLRDAKAREEWPNRELIQISESMTARAIRTKEWTYCVADLGGDTSAPASASYREYQMYDQRADPQELVNLAGRKEYRKEAEELREELKKLIVTSGERKPEIVPAKLYP
ncbi:MAG: sulfatase-like hydrolase/transferase [Terracidiphilus sp.]